MKKSIAIIGTGAVGGYYGSLLQKSGQEVHFLARSDYSHIISNGLRVYSPKGNIILPHINVYSHAEEMPPCDILIVSLKTTANAALKTILPLLAKDTSTIITLQNGLSPERDITDILPHANVLGGLCFLCANKVEPGIIQHIDYGLITLGAFQHRGITPTLQEAGQLLTSAGIDCQLMEDLTEARWKKLVWNIPFNGLSVVENCLTDTLIQHPEKRKRCIQLMKEVITAARAVSGLNISPKFIEKMITNTEKMQPYAPSMKLDFMHGRPMEIESIYAAPLRAAASSGISMPETTMLYRQLLARQNL